MEDHSRPFIFIFYKALLFVLEVSDCCMAEMSNLEEEMMSTLLHLKYSDFYFESVHNEYAFIFLKKEMCLT